MPASETDGRVASALCSAVPTIRTMELAGYLPRGTLHHAPLLTSVLYVVNFLIILIVDKDQA